MAMFKAVFGEVANSFFLKRVSFLFQPFNVARVLSKLRSQRMSLIRTVEQYRFVYALLIQYLKNSRLI